MKIIEALKQLPLLEKRINKNISLLQEYSSDIDRAEDTDLPFKTPEAQQKEVNEIMQATEDLVRRRGKIRRALAITNAQVEVEIEGITATITEWIEYRERGMNTLIKMHTALNDNTAQKKVNQGGVDLSKGLKTLRFYDEKERNQKIQDLTITSGMIDSTLETVNAVTDIAIEV